MRMIHPNEIDLIYHRLTFAVNNLLAVHHAMAEGVNDPSFYVDAVYASADYIGLLLGELHSIYDGDEVEQCPQ